MLNLYSTGYSSTHSINMLQRVTMGTDSHEIVYDTSETIPFSDDLTLVHKIPSQSPTQSQIPVTVLCKAGNISSPFSSIIVFVVPAILVLCIAFLIFVIRAKYVKSRLRKAERQAEENGIANFTTARNTLQNEGCLKCNCNGLGKPEKSGDSNELSDVQVEKPQCEIPLDEEVAKMSEENENGIVPRSGILSSPLTKPKSKRNVNFLKVVRFQHLDQNQKYELLGEK